MDKTICVHFPVWPPTLPPDAVYWVDDNGQLQVYEPQPSPSTILASMTMFSKIDSARWVPFFHHLEERGGQIDTWETYEIKEPMTPQAFLDLLRKRV